MKKQSIKKETSCQAITPYSATRPADWAPTSSTSLSAPLDVPILMCTARQVGQLKNTALLPHRPLYIHIKVFEDQQIDRLASPTRSGRNFSFFPPTQSARGRRHVEEVTRVSMDAFQLTGTRDEAGLLINSLRSFSLSLCVCIQNPSHYYFFSVPDVPSSPCTC